MTIPARRARRGASVLAAALLLAACGTAEEIASTPVNEPTTPTVPTPTPPPPAPPPTPAPPQPQEGGTLSIAYEEPYEIGPPTRCSGAECQQILGLTYDGLVEIEPGTGELVYDQAESVEANADNTTWTITLAEGGTFHNGEPVTAQSYVDGLNATVADPLGYFGYLLADIVGYDDVFGGQAEQMSGLRVLDELTFEVTLTEPSSQFPYLISSLGAFTPLSRECAAQPADDPCATPIGNGPYAVQGSWQPGSPLTLRKFDGYGGDEPGHLDKIVFEPTLDPDARVLAWQSGEVDIAMVSPDEASAFPTVTSDEHFVDYTGQLEMLGLPLYVKGYDDLTVRRALSLAIDREQIAGAAFDDAVEPATDVIPPNLAGYEAGGCEYCEYDPEEAKQLWQQGGGVPGNRITLSYGTGTDKTEWVELIAEQWRQTLGVDVTVADVDPGRLAERTSGLRASGPWATGWLPDYDAMGAYLGELYGSAGLNDAGWTSPEFDALIAEGDAAGAPEAGGAAYRNAADLVGQELPMIPLWFRHSSYLVSDGVVDLAQRPTTGLVLEDARITR